MQYPSLTWPLSRALLLQILEDRLSDRFVAELIWERLGYQPSADSASLWSAGPQTPQPWRDAFPSAPPVIAQRPAAVQLTRSIAKEHKQLLKQQLGFAGYRIDQLYPRRTRRAAAVIGCWPGWRNGEMLFPPKAPCRNLLTLRLTPLKGILAIRLLSES